MKEKKLNGKSQEEKCGRVMLIFAIGFFAAFVLWTILIRQIDVQAIGPKGSAVGFATMNGAFHNLTGVHMLIYTITDWLGLVPLCSMLGFAILGLVQLIRRRNLFKVDSDILLLGGFYILVLAAHLFFKRYVINYRPVLMQGYLEASYPSSTTLLVMCVMPTTLLQFKGWVKHDGLRYTVNAVIILFTIFLVLGRTISGVHWFTDIIGGVLLSAGLVLLYDSITHHVLSQFNH